MDGWMEHIQQWSCTCVWIMHDRVSKCQQLQMDLTMSTEEFESAQTRLVQIERDNLEMKEKLELVGVFCFRLLFS